MTDREQMQDWLKEDTKRMILITSEEDLGPNLLRITEGKEQENGSFQQRHVFFDLSNSFIAILTLEQLIGQVIRRES
jgi:hypothetical protein